MGERFGADVADCCYVGVGGWDEGVGERQIKGLGVDSVDDGLDCVFWGLLAEKGEDFLAFFCEGCICCGQSMSYHGAKSDPPSLLYLKSGVSFSLSSVISCWYGAGNVPLILCAKLSRISLSNAP